MDILFEKRALIIFGLIFIVLISACTNDTDTLIHGSWKQLDRDIILEFRNFTEDDDLTYRDKHHFSGVICVICADKEIGGYYKWVDREVIELVLYLDDPDCLEEIHQAQIDSTDYRYRVDELTDSKLILSSFDTPQVLSEYRRVQNQ